MFYMIYREVFFITVAVLLMGSGIDKADAQALPTQTLIMAVEKGDLEKIRALLADNVNVNALDENGRTALMHAASYEDGRVGKNALAMSMAQLLLSRGADVNTVSPEGDTAIMLAAAKVNADVVELLLKEGAKPHVEVVGSDTIVVSGASGGRKPMTTLRLTVGPDSYRGEYTSGAISSAWSRPADPRAIKTLMFLKAASSG